MQVEPILDVVVDCALHEGLLAAARSCELQSATPPAASGTTSKEPGSQPLQVCDACRTAGSKYMDIELDGRCSIISGL